MIPWREDPNGAISALEAHTSFIRDRENQIFEGSITMWISFTEQKRLLLTSATGTVLPVQSMAELEIKNHIHYARGGIAFHRISKTR